MSPTRSEGFEGDLEALSVVDIVQTLSLGGKTARVLVSSSLRRGEIWIQDGAVTHAAAGRLLGDLAVYSLIEVVSGHFAVEYGVSTETRSITQDTTYLVLEGLRRVDERSCNATPASDTEVPPVLEADVRRVRSRRRAVGMLAFGIGVSAIAAACLHDWRGPTQIDAVAAVAAAAPATPPTITPQNPAPQRSMKRSGPSHPAKPQPVSAVPLPLVAPESPADEEPVPFETGVAPSPAIEAPAAQMGSVDEPPRLLVAGKSGADGGTLTVVVDGKPAYTHAQLDKSKPFQASIVLTPGEHVIVARLENGAIAGVHEASTRSVFAKGESQVLRITANRAFGTPVKVKLDRLPPRG
ncbi:MAG TPA: DUF4388 domain-containing protein [Candidatus Polarisedimenticolaceae bacterium]|nr:DUF4388 domain-containing protein [Candidatus Polarisedimenticolaceae bacterium]